MYNDIINGYHAEISGNGYDLLIRECDNKVIATYEGDYYNGIEEMTYPSYKSSDYEALEAFADYVGF